MSRVCELTGKKVIVGNKVSHSNIKTKRRFYPNLQTKRFFIPEEDKWITLKVSSAALRTIDKKGISAVIKEAREKGCRFIMIATDGVFSMDGDIALLKEICDLADKYQAMVAGMMMGYLILITYVPAISLWLPNLLFQ